MSQKESGAKQNIKIVIDKISEVEPRVGHEVE
jgi:hypothetical protein